MWSIIKIPQIDRVVNIYLEQRKLLENGGCNDLLRDSAALSVVCFLEMEKEESGKRGGEGGTEKALYEKLSDMGSHTFPVSGGSVSVSGTRGAGSGTGISA